MNTATRQTKLGQAGLLIAAFSTPFAVMAGTGGYANAQPLETTGNSIFIIGSHLPTDEQIRTAQFVRNLERLIKDFSFNKSQISTILGVSRPTINSWFDGTTEKIREQHRLRLIEIMTAFDQEIDPSLRSLAGQLFRKKLDATVSNLLRLILEPEFPKNEVDSALKILNFKLSGVTRSNQLSATLEDKKPLI